MDEAASKVHEERICLKDPRKTVTPYGGQLEWTLPGRNKMVAHLKDSSRIRHRKRWSQVSKKDPNKKFVINIVQMFLYLYQPIIGQSPIYNTAREYSFQPLNNV